MCHGELNHRRSVVNLSLIDGILGSGGDPAHRPTSTLAPRFTPVADALTVVWQTRRVSSSQRRRNLWPLPGGAGAYAANLRSLVQVVADGASRQELEAFVAQSAPSVQSASTVRGYAAVPVTLGLVDRQASGKLVLTPPGEKFARTGDLLVLRQALFDRIVGVEELLAEVAKRPATCPVLTERLADHGIFWNHPMAVRYRVWWLVAAAAVDSKRESRVDILTLTPAGRRLLRRVAPAA